MIPEPLLAPLRELVRSLVEGDFEKLEADGRAGRLTATELRSAVAEYGQQLVSVPDDELRRADVYPIKGEEGVWAVDVDLWTTEGRSDLTLSVTMRAEAERISAEIDDLHVL